jgi:hypothetical protein
MTYTEGKSVTVPAGKYWLGDPCYVIKDEMWIEWLESCDYTKERHLVGKTPDGHFALGFNTADGDGVYQDQFGFSYGVDAGLIGLVAYEHNPKGEDLLSQLVEFTSDVVAEVDENFKMTFGNIVIETEYEEEDDYDDEDYDEEDDDEDGDYL